MKPRFRLLEWLALCGILCNVVLLYWNLTDASGSIAGCGAGDCAAILASRWSQVFGLPLPVLGLAVYLVLAGALRVRSRFLAAFCYVAVSVAAVWLVFVQAVLLERFCPWCMAAHGVGLVIAAVGLRSHRWDRKFRQGLTAGLAAVYALALGQLYGPVPAAHRIEPVAAGGKNTRSVSFANGRRTFDVSTLPHLGSPEAKHVLVEYFDYQCPACRRMGGYLATLVASHPAEIAVILLPVPLDGGCNPALPPGDSGHLGSCRLTEIALAVWRAKPAAFPAIHRAFLSDSPPDAESALSLARGYVPSADLEESLRDPWIDQLVETNIADWTAFSGKTRQLPKLVIRDQRVLHGLPPGEDEFLRVMEQELGL